MVGCQSCWDDDGTVELEHAMTDTHCGAHGFLVLFRDGVHVISSPSLTLLPHTSGKDIYTWRLGSRPHCSPPQPTSVSLPSSLQKSLAIKGYTLHHHILHLFFFFKHNLPSPPTFATACPEKTHCVPHFCSTPCYTKIFTQALGPFKTTSPSQQQ